MNKIEQIADKLHQARNHITKGYEPVLETSQDDIFFLLAQLETAYYTLQEIASLPRNAVVAAVMQGKAVDAINTINVRAQ